MNPVEAFSRLTPSAEGTEEVYSHRVRYTDLDNNRHMNNLRYVPLLLDAYTPDYHEEHLLTDLEIQYREQCFYDEELKICRQDEEKNTYRLIIRKENGNTAACAKLHFKDIKK